MRIRSLMVITKGFQVIIAMNFHVSLIFEKFPCVSREGKYGVKALGTLELRDFFSVSVQTHGNSAIKVKSLFL
jgi:DNA-directed RNA polymerase specialized sigma54-like protein